MWLAMSTYDFTDAREKEIGRLNQRIIKETLQSLSLYPFTVKLHMSLTDFEDLIGRAAEEAVNTQLKAYFPLFVNLLT